MDTLLFEEAALRSFNTTPLQEDSSAMGVSWLEPGPLRLRRAARRRRLLWNKRHTQCRTMIDWEWVVVLPQQ